MIKTVSLKGTNQLEVYAVVNLLAENKSAVKKNKFKLSKPSGNYVHHLM